MKNEIKKIYYLNIDEFIKFRNLQESLYKEIDGIYNYPETYLTAVEFATLESNTMQNLTKVRKNEYPSDKIKIFTKNYDLKNNINEDKLTSPKDISIRVDEITKLESKLIESKSNDLIVEEEFVKSGGIIDINNKNYLIEKTTFKEFLSNPILVSLYSINENDEVTIIKEKNGNTYDYKPKEFISLTFDQNKLLFSAESYISLGELQDSKIKVVKSKLKNLIDKKIAEKEKNNGDIQNINYYKDKEKVTNILYNIYDKNNYIKVNIEFNFKNENSFKWYIKEYSELICDINKIILKEQKLNYLKKYGTL